MVTASNEERIARLESGYEHFATKSDLAEMEARLLAAIMNGQSETNRTIMNGLSETNRAIMNGLSETNRAIMNGQSDNNRRIDNCNGRIDRVFWAVLGVGGGLLAAAVAAMIRGAI